MKNNNNTKQQQWGQYFTTNNELKQKVSQFILNKPEIILEPSFGRGDLVCYIQQQQHAQQQQCPIFHMYEIDTTIIPLPEVVVVDIENLPHHNNNTIIYGDFLQQNITTRYKTIIGNPPYVKTHKRRGNLYIDFVEKCVDLLDENGELIFIVPADFFKTTGASSLLNRMYMNGIFTHIYHPHDEHLFAGASIDVLIFRYCKTTKTTAQQQCLYNDELVYTTNSDGLITFHKKPQQTTTTATNATTTTTDGVSMFGTVANRFYPSTTNEDNNNELVKNHFTVYVGMVSGKEEVFKNAELGNIEVLNGENKIDKYIYIEQYPCDSDAINAYLQGHKEVLMNRKIRKMNETNWFEWGALRNKKIVEMNLNKDCIYMYNLTRKTKVAFLGKVGRFGGNLLMLLPTTTAPVYTLNKIVDYFNSEAFKDNFMFSGRFKIGHRQISQSYIPISSAISSAIS